MVSKKISILFRMALISGVLLCACQNEGEGKKTGLHVEFTEFDPGKETGSDREEAEQWERGYRLPIEKQEQKEAEADCDYVMKSFFPIYEQAEKGKASNVVLSDDTVFKIQKKVGETGYPVYTMIRWDIL